MVKKLMKKSQCCLRFCLLVVCSSRYCVSGVYAEICKRKFCSSRQNWGDQYLEQRESLIKE